MNAAELREKSEQELRDELLALRREQFNLRMQRWHESRSGAQRQDNRGAQRYCARQNRDE